MSLKKALTVSLLCVLFASTATAKSVGNPRYASLVIDAKNGMILSETNAGEYRYPASLTKMMTLYVAFSALEQGRLSENQLLTVSPHAARQARTKIGFRSGDKISVKDALQSLVIISANDSAVVVAEALGNGSEQKFAELMTSTARKLGMSHSTFMNASGLHHPKQQTTAYDMARLAIALRRDFPQYYPLFDKSQFTYKGRTYYSHNHVARKYQGADGVKTGFIGASGYNLVTSASRNGRYIVGAVFGGQTFKRRDDHMIKLLDHAFFTLAKGTQPSNAYAIKMPNRITPAQAIALGSVNAPTTSKITAEEVAQEIAVSATNEPAVPAPQVIVGQPEQVVGIVTLGNTRDETKEVLEAMAKNALPASNVTEDFTATSLEGEGMVSPNISPLPQVVPAPAPKAFVVKKQVHKKKTVKPKAKKVQAKPVKAKARIQAKAKLVKKPTVVAAKKVPQEEIPVPVLKP